MKKKISIITLSAAMSMSAFAEGYQVNMLSAKQSGMGHVGVAMKLGAESMHFNPAGLGFLEGYADFSVGVSGIMAEATYTNKSITAKTDNKLSTPMYAYGAFRINDYLKAGIAVTTPYGSSLNWGKDWVGAGLVQDISLQSFSFQPTISWKVSDNFSIGAGAMIVKGDFSLSRSLMHGSMLAPLKPLLPPAMHPMLDKYANENLLSTTLSGDSKVGVGFNVGVMWDVNEKVTIGASYRSRVSMKVDAGKADLQYFDKTIEGLVGKLPAGTVPAIDKGTFAAELPLPANLTLGVSYKPVDRLTLALDLQGVGWGTYESLNVQFSEEADNYEIHAVKDYKHTIIARLGADYLVSNRWNVRAGIYFDETPVNENYYNPETPGMNKIGTSVGFSYRPFDGFSIDFSALYIAGLSRNGSYPIDDKGNTFSGHYDTTAFAPTLGVSYAF